MTNKVEITIDVIVHATEDIQKMFQAFEKKFGLKEKDFAIEEIIGHYGNPIIMLNTKIVKKNAQNFIHDLFKSLPRKHTNRLIEEIEERVINSRFHMRLDKQELIKGNLMVRDQDTIQLKIFTPIYNKKYTSKIFAETFQIAN